MDTITFDTRKREALRRAYGKAVEAKLEQFTFDGHEFVTAYAKYLLEYLDTKRGTQ